MKKILRLLGASILTASVVPMAVVACSAEPEEEIIGNSNAEELLLTAQNEIDIAFSNLLKKNENIINENYYEKEGTLDIVNTYFASLPEGAVIDNSVTKKGFLDRIKTNIENSIIPDLLKLNELEPLFRNINRDNILKIVDDKTEMIKQEFIWNGGVHEFGISDYTPDKFKIRMWYKIKLNLCLNLCYNDETNKETIAEHKVSYVFWYCNKDADIIGLIKIASAEVEKEFDNYRLELSVDSLIDNNNNLGVEAIKNQAMEALRDKLKNNHEKKRDKDKTLPSSSGIEITDIAFQTREKLKRFDKKGTILNTMLNKKDKASAKKYLIDDFLSPLVKKFERNLKSFIKLNKFNVAMDISKCNDFGTVTITDWNIKGLILNPFEIKYIKGRFDQTHEQWKTNIATVITEILYPKTDFGMRFDMITDGNLTVTMNPVDFDTFVNDNKTMGDVCVYFRSKMNKTAKAKNVINRSKRVRVDMEGYWDEDVKPKLSSAEYFTGIGSDTLELPLKKPLNRKNAVSILYDSIGFRYGSQQISKDRYGSFKKTIIKRGTTNFWE